MHCLHAGPPSCLLPLARWAKVGSPSGQAHQGSAIRPVAAQPVVAGHCSGQVKVQHQGAGVRQHGREASGGARPDLGAAAAAAAAAGSAPGSPSLVPSNHSLASAAAAPIPHCIKGPRCCIHPGVNLHCRVAPRCHHHAAAGHGLCGQALCLLLLLPLLPPLPIKLPPSLRRWVIAHAGALCVHSELLPPPGKGGAHVSWGCGSQLWGQAQGTGVQRNSCAPQLRPTAAASKARQAARQGWQGGCGGAPGWRARPALALHATPDASQQRPPLCCLRCIHAGLGLQRNGQVPGALVDGGASWGCRELRQGASLPPAACCCCCCCPGHIGRVWDGAGVIPHKAPAAGGGIQGAVHCHWRQGQHQLLLLGGSLAATGAEGDCGSASARGAGVQPEGTEA